MTISEKTRKRSPYLKAADRAAENSQANIVTIILTILFFTFLLGLLVLGNIWVWTEIF
jgi:hypothetical protein